MESLKKPLQYEIHYPEKAILDYFYLNAHLSHEADFKELRMNQEVFQEQVSEEKLEKYLEGFHHKALRKRIHTFLTLIKNA